MDELLDSIPCAGGSCSVTSAPVGVTAGATTAGISFELRSDLIFGDGFE